MNITTWMADIAPDIASELFEYINGEDDAAETFRDVVEVITGRTKKNKIKKKDLLKMIEHLWQEIEKLKQR